MRPASGWRCHFFSTFKDELHLLKRQKIQHDNPQRNISRGKATEIDEHKHQRNTRREVPTERDDEQIAYKSGHPSFCWILMKHA